MNTIELNIDKYESMLKELGMLKTENEELKKRLLTSHNSDYAKSCDDCIYGVDGCQHEPPCTTGTGKPYYKKRDFA
jgi:hypothetical protein